MRPLHRFASGRRIGGVVLAALALEPVRGNELRCHQPNGVTVTNEQPRPVVGTGARFHADHARWQGGDQLVQLRTRHARTHELGLAGFIDATDGEDVLGKIDADGDNGHALPLPSALMRVRTSHRGTSMPVAAMRLARDGEVPFIR